MNSKVDIKGGAEVAVSHNQGSITINHFYGDKKESAVDPEVSRLVARLLSLCDQRNHRDLIQNICQDMYGTKTFTSLEEGHLRVLITVANRIFKVTDGINLSTLVSEKQFYDLTGINASAPAREALIMLLNEGDVNSKQIKKVWKSELDFKDNQLQLKIPKFALIESGLYAAAALLLFLMAFLLSPRLFNSLTPFGWEKIAGFVAIEIVFMVGIGLLAWLSGDSKRPHTISKHIQPLVEQVNAKLKSSNS